MLHGGNTVVITVRITIFLRSAMIVCIGAKMHYENRNFSVDNTVQISSALWYMFFGALIIPLAGVFTFGISNFYSSVQEYPIGYFLDLLDSVIRRSKEQGARSTIETELSSEKAKKTVRYMIADFKYVNGRFPLKKYYYVFWSPLLITLSII